MKYKMFNVIVLLARNVVFTDITDDVINNLLNHTANNNVKKWITNNIVKKLLQNDYRGDKVTDPKKLSSKEKKKADPKNSGWLSKINKNNPIYVINVTNVDRNTWLHWVDYLNTLEGNINFGLEKIEEKVHEWEEATYKVKTKAAQEEKRRKAIAIDEDGIEDIHVYPNGFKWVRVFGKKSLNREGELMEHCVGSYYEEVKNNNHVIYSLRDKANVPHCTIDYIPNEKLINQIKGFANTTVSPKYIPYVKDFLDKRYVKYEDVDFDESGLIKIKDKIYRLDHLPNKIDGNLDLSGNKVTKLPDNFKVTGDLDVSSSSEISELPENLEVGGNLNISYSRITKLPANLKVGGDLKLSSTEIKELPDNLEIGGTLDLYRSIMTKLPDNLKVDSLDLSNTYITDLPANLKVTGDLDLLKSYINRLSANIEIGGNLSLYRTRITELPNNLIVHGDLDLSETNISKLPDDLKVGGNLKLCYTKIANIPVTLDVHGNLDLTESEINRVPPGLNVKGIIWDSYLGQKVKYSKVKSNKRPTK